MDIQTAEQFGRAIRAHRKKQGLTQVQLAAIAHVGPRFIGELEHGKATIELGKALYVALLLGLELQAKDW